MKRRLACIGSGDASCGIARAANRRAVAIWLKDVLQVFEQFRQMREFFRFDAGQQLLTNGRGFVL